MMDTITFPKKNNNIIINDTLHILKFINDDQSGGQSTIAFALNLAMGERLEIMKFYGLIPLYEDPNKKVFCKPNNTFWSEIRNHEISAIGQLSAHFPRWPVVYERGEYNDALYISMSLGREQDSSKMHEHANFFNITDYDEGKVLTLEQIIYNKPHSNNPKQKDTINRIRNYDWKTKLRYFTEMLRNVSIIHKYDIVHNDLKPSQFLFITLNENNHIIQTIDLGSHINCNNINNQKCMYYPTTLMYNSKECIETYIAYATGDRSIIQKLTPETLKLRDIYSLGLIGCEFLLGTHPYANDVMLNLERHNLQKTKFENSLDPSAGYLERCKLLLNSINNFLKDKNRFDYSNNISTPRIPMRIERMLYDMIK